MSHISPSTEGIQPASAADDLSTPEMTHPIAKALSGLAQSADVDDDVRNCLLTALNDYFEKNTIFRCESFSEAANTLYAQDDNELYDVLSIWNIDHYDFFVSRSSQDFVMAVGSPSVYFLKSLGRYERQELHTKLQCLGELVKAMKKLLKQEYIFTARRSTGPNEMQEVKYPPFEQLKLFYECERKIKHKSYEDGLERLESGNHVYLCPTCNHYHQGRPRQATTVQAPEPEEMLRRYQRIWRQYHNV